MPWECSICGQGPMPDGQEHWDEIRGWAVSNRPGGGTHHVAGREPTGRVACVSCVTRIRSGVPTEQGRLDTGFPMNADGVSVIDYRAGVRSGS